MTPEELSKVEWCKHIHNWGAEFYFVDTHDPFPVLTINGCQFILAPWKVCPICLTPAPVIGGGKE